MASREFHASIDRGLALDRVFHPNTVEPRPEFIDHLDFVDADTQALVKLCHTVSVAKGWYHDPITEQPVSRNFGECIALKHTELSEALEGHRSDLMSDHIEGFTRVEEEFADVVIRLCDTSGAMQLRLGAAIVAKIKFNLIREDHSLAARALAGGKAY